MTKAVTLARLAFGLIFVVFGLDYFLTFLPALGDPSPQGMAFLEAIMATGYLFPLIKAIEIGAGLLLLSGWRAPLGLVLLAPIVLNIALYHLMLDRTGLWLGLTVAVLEAFLLWAFRDCFRPLLQASSESAYRPAGAVAVADVR